MVQRLLIRWCRGSDATALGRPASVVGRGRDVRDGADLEADRTKGPDRRLAARARAFDEDVDLLHAVLHRPTARRLGGHLRSERRGLARALEADGAGRGPRDHGPGGVGDRHDGVVERALDVGFALSDVLLLLAAHLLGAGSLTALGRHTFAPNTRSGGSRARSTRGLLDPGGRSSRLAGPLRATGHLA